MKERIVLEKEVLCKLLDWVSMQTVVYEDDDLKKERKIVLFGKEYKAEKVPETWEDLKELCTKEDISKCDNTIEIRMNDDVCLYFYKNGHICCMNENSDLSLGYDRTPQQMWQIIKGLIGE